MKISEQRVITRSGVALSILGLGSASFGGLYNPVTVNDALAAMRQAWQAGIRYFDVAPMYGLGRAEHLLGHFLREEVGESDGVTLSTKVGRLMALPRPGRNLPLPAPKNPMDAGWQNGLKFQEVFDYSYDGIMRSFDDSQQRLGQPEIDLLFVHDIGRLTHGERHEFHWKALTTGGFKALRALRDAGLIKGFGLGVNEIQALDEAMSEVDLDCCLLAGRYTLLDRSAEALLDKAYAEGVSIVMGGVFNSGILAANAGGPRKFDYMDAPAEIIRRVEHLTAVCARYGVPLGAAAVQFPLRKKVVKSVLVGARSAENVTTAIEWLEQEIPAELWTALEAGV